MTSHHSIAFWKPFGVLSKFTDAAGRETLADHIDLPDVWGAGRLDRDSEGLLVLTSDPRLRTLLTAPESKLPKTYLVQVEGVPGAEQIDQLCSGVMVKGKLTRPADAAIVGPPELPDRAVPIRVRKSIPDSWISLTIREGRNRQVRRMTAAVGHPTLRLVRVQVGPVSLRGLTQGNWRDLSGEELAALQQLRRR